MKEFYRVQYMSKDSYNNYMGGGYNYNIHNMDVLAENAEEAQKIVQQNNANMVINPIVKKVAEIEAEEVVRKIKREVEEKRAIEKKVAKVKRAIEHPEEDAEKKRQANIRRYKRLIEKQKEEIAKQKRELTRLENKLKKLEG